MNNTMLWLVLVLLLLAAGLLAGSMYFRRRARSLPQTAAPAIERSASESAWAPEEPVEVAIPVAFRLASASGAPPVLTATALDVDAFRLATTRARPLNTRSGGVSRLAPILKSVRLSAAGAEPDAPQYLNVVLDSALARSADGERLSAFVLDHHGRIIDHSRLQRAGRLPFGFGGTLLFQTIRVIVAQKHLKDIDAQLDRILLQMARRPESQGRELNQAVRAIADALVQRLPEVEAGVLDAQWQPQLDTHDRCLARIQAQLREEVQSAVAGLGEITTGFLGAARKRQEQIESSIQRFERSLSEWQVATEARILGWSLLVAVSDAPHPKLERRLEIEHEIDLLFAGDGLTARFDRAVRDEVAKIQRLLFKADASRRREQLVGQQAHRRQTLREQHDALLQRIVAVTTIEQTREAPLRLALQLDGEDIVEAHELAVALPEDTAVAAEPESVAAAVAAADSPGAVVEAPAPAAASTLEATAEAPQEVEPLLADALVDGASLADAPEPEPLAKESPDMAPSTRPADQAVRVEAVAIEVERRPG